MDELPEFDPACTQAHALLEVMRQPLEDHEKNAARSSWELLRNSPSARAPGTLTFPANFMLVAAMNPCPCGAVEYLATTR